MKDPAARRLLVVVQPVEAGVPRAVADALVCLPEGTFAVDVACPRGSQLWCELESRPGVRLHPIPSARRPVAADLTAMVRLVRLARRADVIHVHSTKSGLLGRLAAFLARKRRRCVFSPHGWSFWAVGGVAARIAVVIERAAARCCARIVCVSAHERDAGLAAGIGRPAQYRVIHNGIDLDRFSADPQPVAGRAVMVARLAPQKDPMLAVHALALARRHLFNATLHLAGDGPLRAEVERARAALGLDGALAVLGSYHDIPGILATASCLVLSSRYEGCPVTVLEALAAGVPVVTTPFAGAHEVVEHGRTGLVATPGVAGLATALVEMLRDPERAAAMGHRAREVARARFDRRDTAAQLVHLYDEIAG